MNENEWQGKVSRWHLECVSCSELGVAKDKSLLNLSRLQSPHSVIKLDKGPSRPSILFNYQLRLGLRLLCLVTADGFLWHT